MASLNGAIALGTRDGKKVRRVVMLGGNTLAGLEQLTEMGGLYLYDNDLLENPDAIMSVTAVNGNAE